MTSPAQPTAPYPILVMREMRRVARLGFPVVISLAAATLIGVVDTIMIAPLGTVPLAAASITASAMMIFYSALYGFVSAVSVRMAEAHGKSDAAELSGATKTGVIVTFATGMIGAVLMLALKPFLTLLGQPPEVIAALGGYWITMSLLLVPFTVFYALKSLFDALDAPWIGVGLAFVAVVLNIPANWVLIHGVGTWQGFGLLGAGLASLLSQTVSLLIAWVIWQRAPIMQNARHHTPRTPQELRRQLKEGVVIAVGYIGEGGAYAFASLMMGWFGAAALAATQIVTSVGNVLYMVPMGISIAVSIRIGQAIGANERERLTRIGLAAFLLIVFWMTCVMIGVLLGGAAMSNALSQDPQVVAIATGLFVVIAAMQIADGVQGTMLGACRGMTDNSLPVMITLVSYWAIALPMAYLFGFHLGYGPNAVWMGYSIGLAIAATLITWRYFARANQTRAKRSQ